MKRRGKKVLLISLGAVVVALLALALVYREQPPYEFLRGAERVRTTVVTGTRGSKHASTVYLCDLSFLETVQVAREELASKGWTGYDIAFRSPGSPPYETIRIWDGDQWRLDERSLGKTMVSWNRPANVIDVFNAWLDRVTW